MLSRLLRTFLPRSKHLLILWLQPPSAVKMYGRSLILSLAMIFWLLHQKNLPAMQEPQVQSLVWEDPLEKEMATHSSILAWKIPQRGLVDHSPWGCRVGHDWVTEHIYIYTHVASNTQTTKAKINKWDYIKLKIFHIGEKITITKLKRQPTGWEKIAANHISDNELISEINFKNSIKNKEKLNVFKNGQRS